MITSHGSVPSYRSIRPTGMRMMRYRYPRRRDLLQLPSNQAETKIWYRLGTLSSNSEVRTLTGL